MANIMSKNIEIQIKTDTTYETLYPKTLGSLVDGKVSSSTQSDSANILTTGRTIRTNLASTSTATFDGSSNITPGVSGTLTVSNGGTGVTSYSALATKLSSYLSSGGVVVQSISYIGDGNSSTSHLRKTFPSVSGKTLKFCLYNFNYNSSGSLVDISDNIKYVCTTGVLINFDIDSEKQWTLNNTNGNSNPIVASNTPVEKYNEYTVTVNNYFNKNNIIYYLTGIWI